MHDILKLIVEAKKKSVELLKKSETEIMGLVDKAPKPVSLAKALKADDDISIIAEIKQASPSEGVIRQDFNHMEILKIYEEMGAKAISVLTEEEFFLGKTKYLQEVKAATKLPVLRKDFILDEIQIYQSRALGADAVLLIHSILPIEKLEKLYKIAKNLGMDVLVEVHTLKELKNVIKLNVEIIGINNRNLNSFKVDIATTEKLASLIPSDTVKISESGINCLKDVLMLKGVGVDAMLIGSAFMRSPNIKDKFNEFLTGCVD